MIRKILKFDLIVEGHYGIWLESEIWFRICVFFILIVEGLVVGNFLTGLNLESEKLIISLSEINPGLSYGSEDPYQVVM